MTTLFRAIKFSASGNNYQKLINGVQKINKLMTTLFTANKFSACENKIIGKIQNSKHTRQIAGK